MSFLQIFCRTVEFFEPQERRLSLSATQSGGGGGGSSAGGQGKKENSAKEQGAPDSAGKDKKENENTKVTLEFCDIFLVFLVNHKYTNKPIKMVMGILYSTLEHH